ncbi:hypothetical protein QM007_06775 [Rothia sp. SD9660Na]|uniref:hypothetical protein n=1 Tax=Rothia sp. SD9660Na TaxID=3047030 RepID=UPI0024BB43AB|nr:hypothetical protein [Rothia sp. SD9660Na]WHS49632.1 hypothetical protein QM007_06775 [Rothia sp. SD9660Na]
MTETKKSQEKTTGIKSAANTIYLQFKRLPFIHIGLIVISAIVFGFIIFSLIPGARYGEYKGLKANEWLSFWGSLVLPLLLLVIPTATYHLNQKEINRKAASERRNEEWERWVKLYEINKENPQAAQSLFIMYDSALKEDGIQRSRSEHHFFYRDILKFPYDIENEGVEVDSAEEYDRNEDPAFYEDLINSMSERGHSQETIDTVQSFYRKSDTLPYLQTSSIGKSTQIFSVLYKQNKKRIGVMSVSSTSLYFDVGFGKKSFKESDYDMILKSVYKDSNSEPTFNRVPTKSEGYLREPLRFYVENLSNEEFFQNTISLIKEICIKKFNR